MAYAQRKPQADTISARARAAGISISTANSRIRRGVTGDAVFAPVARGKGAYTEAELFAFYERAVPSVRRQLVADLMGRRLTNPKVLAIMAKFEDLLD